MLVDIYQLYNYSFEDISDKYQKISTLIVPIYHR